MLQLVIHSSDYNNNGSTAVGLLHEVLLTEPAEHNTRTVGNDYASKRKA